ncbi:MAG: prepilin-type N-terminal cleavage/methylation domain-containing protein [Sedimentisphaerales bacterium]|nr:prepilin-type N-terminal cleavage/methylation domain-containing protein [Sedimentisphaerales bacterium]
MTLTHHPNGKNGFTLLEILVATIIAAFISVTAVAALRAVIGSQEKLEERLRVNAELRYAAHQIRQDCMNFYRSRDPRQTKLVATLDRAGGVPSSRIVFYLTNTLKARRDYPEGDLYEVEYFLEAQEPQDGAEVTEDSLVLMRRLWPNPNADARPAGVVAAVARGILIFSVRYYDGQEWLEEWPAERQDLPQAVMVDLATKTPRSNELLTEKMLIRPPRWPGSQPSGGSDLLNTPDTGTSG